MFLCLIVIFHLRCSLNRDGRLRGHGVEARIGGCSTASKPVDALSCRHFAYRRLLDTPKNILTQLRVKGNWILWVPIVNCHCYVHRMRDGKRYQQFIRTIGPHLSFPWLPADVASRRWLSVTRHCSKISLFEVIPSACFAVTKIRFNFNYNFKIVRFANVLLQNFRIFENLVNYHSLAEFLLLLEGLARGLKTDTSR